MPAGWNAPASHGLHSLRPPSGAKLPGAPAIGSLERMTSCRKPHPRTLVLSGEDWLGNQRAWLGAMEPRAQAWFATGLFDRIFVEQKDVHLPGFETYPIGLSRHYTIGREERLLAAARLAADLHARGEKRGVLAAWGKRSRWIIF